MKARKTTMLGTFIVALMLLILLGVVMAEGDIHWTYEGEEGPEHWGELDAAWSACGEGEAQSPINLAASTEVSLKDIEVHYGEVPLKIFNNGHTIQVNVDEGNYIVYNEIQYNLLQFHFHHPSEHEVDGVTAAMEIHFVNASATGNLAVIGVMLFDGDTTNENYAAIFDNLPTEEGEAPEESDMMIDLNSLLPEGNSFFTYNGSLTTPPCSEIVRWLVMSDPVSLSADQVGAFASIFEANARPVQPLNDRDLLFDID